MNIFDEYINKITSLIVKNKDFLELNDLNDFKGITVETPPSEYNFDLSCNAGLVLGKINNINPKVLAKKIKITILKDLNDFEQIEVAGAGFLNLKRGEESNIETINLKL